jgi:hypothetical protein
VVGRAVIPAAIFARTTIAIISVTSIAVVPAVAVITITIFTAVVSTIIPTVIVRRSTFIVVHGYADAVSTKILTI